MCRLILTAGLCLIIASLVSCDQENKPGYQSGASGYQSGASSVNFCSGRSDGLYAYPPDPQRFYQCSNGNTFILSCPASLVFSAISRVCDWPSATGTFCIGKADGNYVNTNNLNSFYMCSNGRTVVQDCQKGLIYKPSCNCCQQP
ncbi:chitin-binding domain protein cbd-1-like [Anabas testudineus]|uniref:chitin-binding domain protein cbd-1-like n=1 Tax=Anabas testudineus TaxID=64144 RepID=UPI000E4611AD|nr:chitin-binding domain protein cbd-1-like [Anabas testudineus]